MEKMLEIPSQIKDRHFIRMPQKEKVVDSDEEWSRCGMWILSNKYGEISWIDEVWIKLQALLTNDCLLLIKASTTLPLDDLADEGLILCYTRAGEKEIEHAAIKIRETVHYEACMYYKINRVTQDKIANRYGDVEIAEYMHTFRGFFYKKDPVERWVLVSDTECRDEIRSSFPMEINADGCEEIDFDELPSRTEKIFLEMLSEWKSIVKKPTHTHISIKCRLDAVKNKLSEADRLWLVAKKLINEGIIDKVTCRKKFNVAKFIFLPLDELSSKDFVVICEKIYQESKVFKFIYKFTDDKNYKKYRNCSRYSPEKELYVDHRFVSFEKAE